MSNVIQMPKAYYLITKVVNGKRVTRPFRGEFADIPKGYSWCGRRVVARSGAAA